MNIKDIIKQKRLQKKLTMKELAILVDVSEATISRWESGHIATLKQTKITRLANALGISEAELIPSEDISSISSVPYPADTDVNKLYVNSNEKELIEKYRQLDADDQEEVVDIIDSKLRRAKRKSDEAAPKEAM